LFYLFNSIAHVRTFLAVV